MNQQAAQAYPPHDCLAWNVQHYVSNAGYRMTVCGVCNRVNGFRWNSWPDRIRGLFTSVPVVHVDAAD